VRSRFRKATAALSAVLILSLSGAAWPQPAPTSKPAAPAPAPALTAAPKAPKGKGPEAAATAKPGASASPTASPTGSANALPPGHPQVINEMPPGHPPVGEEEEAPHGGTPARPAPPPAGHGRGGDPGENIPEDTATEDPSVPRGVVIVTIKDAEERAIPRAPIKLDVLHSSVAKGDSREELTRETDEQGSFRFEGLTIGSGTSYRVTTTRGPATYDVGPFVLSDQAGKRVVLHSYEVARNIEDVLVAMQSVSYVSLREDAISIEHLFSIFNLGTVAWAPDVTITLPEGFKAFNKPESAENVRFDEVKGKGAVLRGTVAPGRHDVTFRYQVPLEGDEQQAIRVELPPRVAQARVMVEASKTMAASVAGFPATQRSQNRDGKRILVTDRQVSRNEGGLRTLDITLTGLPTPGPGRWIAVVLALISIAGAAAYAFQRRDARELAPDAREDLLDAREALLREIVELERLHRRGDIGPKTYDRIRGALLDSLARIVSMLEGDRDADRDRAKAAAAQGSAQAAEP
jgi:hypothetical protein